jgi:hypothetical protein
MKMARFLVILTLLSTAEAYASYIEEDSEAQTRTQPTYQQIMIDLPSDSMRELPMALTFLWTTSSQGMQGIIDLTEGFVAGLIRVVKELARTQS